ncbi:SGNH/GDSL hydrolase family protein [Malacoplasma penetrans]|uniref:Predicted lipase n=1 Tax=Malacoplasma penetrans (strain HF-2) TaxID=272633 RepID=Q8EVG1_MALP2|nr:SGNH/GDSL hydrolase family protein [Malacoplasma penetrans]RXY96934.1 SGNH/GDSL hydrolase family protein [Malacoplasma penetrans]BAC44393.1 predicted lipase [Malacoplasma penetrans HF-2]
MASKKVKWAAFVSTILLVGGIVIPAPIIATEIFWANYKSKNTNYDIEYPLPETGSDVSTSIATWGVNEDRISSNPEDNLRFQEAIENTWMFAGGSDFYSNFDILKSRKNWIGLFDENLRWNFKIRQNSDPSTLYSTMARFVINVSKPNQTLKELNDKFAYKVSRVDPKNVVTIVGKEYIEAADEYESLVAFENDLTTFIKNSLTLRESTSTVSIIKHWKVPLRDYKEDKTFNTKVDKFNNVVNKVLYNLYIDDEYRDSLTRVKVIDWTDMFMDNSTSQGEWPFDEDNNIKSLVAHNKLGRQFMLAYDNGVPWTQGQLDPSSNTYGDFSNSYTEATTMDAAVDTRKNHLSLGKITQTENTSTVTYKNQPLVNLTVEVPNAIEGQYLKYSLEITDSGLTIQDYSYVSNGAITIDNIAKYDTTVVSPYSGVNYTNSFDLTVFDIDGLVYNRVGGTLGDDASIYNIGSEDDPSYKSNSSSDSTVITSSASTSASTSNNSQDTTSTISVAKQRFLEKFNDKSKPMVWAWIGDSVDHGVAFDYGFDNFSEVVQKSVQSDWGRWDDIFVNGAISGDFTNRAVDPYMLHSRITKYAPDVLSIGLGISDKQNIVNNGQQVYSGKEQFQNNMKTLVETAIASNPDVIVVINGINPTGFNGRTGVPAEYNNYLKEIFDGENNQYPNNVIYNGEVFEALESIKTNYPWLYGLTYTGAQVTATNYNWFMSRDKLHPGGGVNLIKGKTFLSSLGINVEDSYLDSYQIKAGNPLTTTASTGKIDVTVSTGSSYAVPNIKTWLSSYPMGGNSNTKSEGNVGSLYSTIYRTDVEDDRTYFLHPGYKSLAVNATTANNPNNYVLPYLESGTYTMSSWAISRLITYTFNSAGYYDAIDTTFTIN